MLIKWTSAAHKTLSNIQSQSPNILSFLEWLCQRSPNEFISLFDGTRQAAEKEAMVFQTIHAMVKNYHADGQLSSLVALHPDGSLAKNSTAFGWLVDNEYFAVDGDRCTITQLAIIKLYVHFADKLEVQPIAITGN
jgi:hypothetical protein